MEIFGLDLFGIVLVCALVFMAGFVDAVAGGGGLISLPAYLIAGLPVHNALATNKLSSCMGTAVATFKYARKGFIPWGTALICAIFAFLGGSLGAAIALAVPEDLFLMIMLFALPMVAIAVMRGKILDDGRPALSKKVMTLIAMASAFAIGIYDGAYGPGTGTFLIILLTGLARMPLDMANGTTKVINLTTNVSALMVFLVGGKTYLILGLTAGLFSIAGNYLGSTVFADKGAKSVRPLMLVVLAIFFVKVVGELLGAF